MQPSLCLLNSQLIKMCFMPNRRQFFAHSSLSVFLRPFGPFHLFVYGKQMFDVVQWSKADLQYTITGLHLFIYLFIMGHVLSRLFHIYIHLYIT
jgi:hypothetical protein